MTGTPEKRFLAKFSKGGGCWEWTAGFSSCGYGTFHIGKRSFTSHSVAWRLFVGPIPPGICVLHKCDNRKCVRPDHLFLGTKKDNAIDMTAKGRNHICDLRGEDHGMSKLTNAETIAIRQRLAAGEKGNYLAKVYGVSTALISLIKSGKVR